MKQNLHKLTSLITIIAALLATTSLVFAQQGAKVYLQPVESGNGQVTVDVMAENVTDMYGAEFQLKFDPAAVSVQDANPDQEGIQIAAGTLLPTDKGFVVANQVNQAEGTVVFALTLLNPAPPVSGGGPLARVTFNVLQSGPATINIERAKLVAVDLQTIPSQTAPFTIENAAPQQQQQAEQQQQSNNVAADTNTTPPAGSGSAFPWWIVAAGIIILGALGLGTFVVVAGLNKPKKNQQAQMKRQQPKPTPQRTQPVAPQPVKQQRPQHVPGTRPSAFK